MNDPLFALTGLCVRDFAREHWGMRPLFRAASASAEAPKLALFGLDDVDELIARRGLRTPFARMSRNGDVLASSRFTSGGGAGAEIRDQISDDKVLAEFVDGATLVLQGLHRTWPPIGTFARALAAQLGHPVQVNAYVTPPQSTGFSAHYDVHDVFVVQFAGAKHWRVHAPVWELPTRDQPWNERRAAVAARANEAPSFEATLQPGDVLYLPRGFVHAASALGEVSGHLTIGVHPVTRLAIVDEIAAQLANELALRRALPLGTDLGVAAAIDGEIVATLDAMRAAFARVDRDAIARGIGTRLAAGTRPEPLAPIAQAVAAFATSAPEHDVRDDLAVRLRAGLRVALRASGEGIVLDLPDRSLSMDGADADAVRTILAGDVVLVSALPVADRAAARALVARLLRAGVVVPAQTERGAI